MVNYFLSRAFSMIAGGKKLYYAINAYYIRFYFI